MRPLLKQGPLQTFIHNVHMRKRKYNMYEMFPILNMFTEQFSGLAVIGY